MDFCQPNGIESNYNMQGQLKIIFSQFMNQFHGIHDMQDSGIDGVFYNSLQVWEWSGSKSVSFYAWVETTSNVPGAKVAAVTLWKKNVAQKICSSKMIVIFLL